jgi:hypothetical protein
VTGKAYVQAASNSGAQFYNNHSSIEDILDHLVARIFDQFGLPAPDAHRWPGINTARTADSRVATQSTPTDGLRQR